MKYRGTPTSDFLNGKPKKVSISLNNSLSLNEILEAIPNAKDITNATAIAIERICQYGEDFAKTVVPVDTGELRDSITHSVDVMGNHVHGTIEAGTDHALFVEFGTGVKGAGTYLGDTTDWVYDIKGQNWQGHPANPFMYNTALEIENNAKEIIKG